MNNYDHDQAYTFQACGFSEKDVDRFENITWEIMKGVQKDYDGTPSRVMELIESAASSDPAYFRFVVMSMVMTRKSIPDISISLGDFLEKILEDRVVPKKKSPAKKSKPKK